MLLTFKDQINESSFQFLYSPWSKDPYKPDTPYNLRVPGPDLAGVSQVSGGVLSYRLLAYTWSTGPTSLPVTVSGQSVYILQFNNHFLTLNRNYYGKKPDGILGRFSGKLGPIVGASWKGINYVRLAPKRKKGKNRTPSPAQLANEMKFKFANDWLVPFHLYVTIGFCNLAIRKTAISAAFSVNYHQAIVGVYPELSVDYTKVVLSMGPLPGLNFPVAELTAADTLEVSWLPNKNNKASQNDQVMLVIYSPELKLTDGFIGSAKRSDKKYSFKFNPRLIGTALEVYISVASIDRRKIADSMYLGRIEPL